ncbi:C40 family peptidase [soil metagenome]
MTAFDWNGWLAGLRAEHLPDGRLGVWEIEVQRPPDGAPRLTGRTSATDAVDAIRRETAARGAETAVGTIPDAAVGDEIRAVARRSLAHLRRQPRHAAELVSQMLMGEEALVLRTAGSWLQVQTADRYVSWVHEGYLLRTAPADAGDFRARLFGRRPPEGTWVVVQRGLVARDSADPGAPPAADLVEGARVTASSRNGALRLTLPDGTTAWVREGAAVPAEGLSERFPPTGRAILDHAAGFLGLSYLWGGTSEKGFDCSGLVQRISALHGVFLPRDSDQQARMGEPVDAGRDGSGIRDGDLAFFAEPPGDRVTHVGILGRGGRMLHAATTRGGVAWDALYAGAPGFSPFGERLRTWLTAIRRVAPEQG